MQNRNTAAIYSIFVILVVDIMSLGMIIPITPALLQDFLGTSVADVSYYGGLFIITYSAAQFIFSPILGNLSDHFGRRPVLLISLLGFGLDYFFMALSPTLTLFILCRLFSGIFGSTYATAVAYIADTSTHENKARNFGLVGAAFGIGFTIGPLLGGFLGHYHLRLPFFVAAGITFTNFLFGYFFIKESLPVEKRRKFEWSMLNPFTSLLAIFKYRSLYGMFIAVFLVYIAFHAVQSTWVYIFMEKFSWQEDVVGYSLSFLGLLMGLVQGVFIRYSTPRLGNRKSVLLGLSLYTAGMLLFAVNSVGALVFPIIIVYCFGGMAGPSMQALISTRVPANEQGKIQGLIASLLGLAAIIGPLLMTRIFFNFSARNAPVYFPGAPFLLGALLMCCSALLMYRITLKPKESRL